MGKSNKYKKSTRKNHVNIVSSKKEIHENTEIINKLISEQK